MNATRWLAAALTLAVTFSVALALAVGAWAARTATAGPRAPAPAFAGGAPAFAGGAPVFAGGAPACAGCEPAKQQPPAPPRATPQKLYGVTWQPNLASAVEEAQKTEPGKPIVLMRVLGKLDDKL